MCGRLLLSCVLFGGTVFCQEPSTAPAQPAKEQAIPVHQETIVVTGTFMPAPLSETNRSVQLFDTRSTPLLFNSNIDYLKLDPEIDLQQRAPNGVQADLTIDGSTFAETLVLLNGLRLNDAQTAHHNMDIPIPLEAISRIEVLHGAGSTLYGSDAMGGAVNFITDPASSTELRIRAGGGNQGFNQEHVFASLLVRNWSETIAADRDVSSGFIPDRDYSSSSASSETRFKSSLGQTDFVFAGSDRPFGADQFYGNFPSWERTKNWFASGEQDLGERTTAAFGYRRHTDEFVLIRDHPSIYENNHIDTSWQAALRRHDRLSDAATLSYGGEGQGDSITSNNLGDHARNREAVYANLDFRTLRRFSLSAGAREEFFSGGTSVFAPAIAAGFWPRQDLKLRASVSRGFRLPTYTDLYYSDPTTVGNPALKPESTWNIGVGTDWDPTKRISAGLTFFRRWDSNLIDYIQTTPGSLYQATNITSLHFTGVEAHSTFRLPRQQEIRLAYTFLHGDQLLQPGVVSRYVFNYPSHNAIFGWSGAWRGWLVARTRVGITQRFEHQAYPVWDLSIARNSGLLRPYLQLANLSNTGYEEIPGVLMPSRSMIAGMELVLQRKAVRH